MSRTVLQADRIHYTTPLGQTLAKDVSFQLNAGSMLLITGPNGIGKSSLLKLILEPDGIASGSLRTSVAKNKITLIPQLQNIEFHLPCSLWDILSISVPNALSEDKVEQIGLLERSQLPLAWNTASGGERQRALFTRAFLKEPQLLLLDEPLNHLDANSRRQLLLALKRFLSAPNSLHAVVMVSHAVTDEMKTLGFEVTQLDLGEYRNGSAS